MPTSTKKRLNEITMASKLQKNEDQGSNHDDEYHSITTEEANAFIGPSHGQLVQFKDSSLLIRGQERELVIPFNYKNVKMTFDDIKASLDSIFNDTSDDNFPIPKLIFDFKLMVTLVRTMYVSVSMCLATLDGFSPEQQKNDLVNNFITKAIKLDDTQSIFLESLINVGEKILKNGLSTISFNVMDYNCDPYNNPIWLLATKRTSIFLSFLSCLALCLRQRGIPFENLIVNDSSTTVTSSVNVTDGEKHMKWLFQQVANNIEYLKNREHVFEKGVTFTNVLNIGHNRVSNEILPFFVQFCKRSLVVKNLELKNPEQIDNPKMRRLSKAGLYIFFSKNYLKDEKMFLKSVKQHLQATTDVVELSDFTKLKTTLEQAIVNDIDKFTNTIPVRWVFLHSLLLSLDVTLIRKAEVVEIAIKCDISMDDSDVEVFLKTFTSFGSLLYIPCLTDIIIVNIELFTDCLDKLYSYSKPFSYGFISESIINSLVDELKLDVAMFKKVVEAFQFVLPITRSQVTDPRPFDFNIDPSSYYVPSMRPFIASSGPQFESLYLHISPEYIPGNMQVLLLRHFLESNNSILHPCAPINDSIIDVQYKDDNRFQLKIIDHGDIIEFRLHSNYKNLAHQDIKQVCFLIVQACYDALENLKKNLDTCKYEFVLRCADLSQSFHCINKQSIVCASCNLANDQMEVNLKKHWINAVFDNTKRSYVASGTQSRKKRDDTNYHIAKLLKENVQLREKLHHEQSNVDSQKMDIKQIDDKSSGSIDKTPIKKETELLKEVTLLRHELQVTQQNKESLQQALLEATGQTQDISFPVVSGNEGKNVTEEKQIFDESMQLVTEDGDDLETKLHKANEKISKQKMIIDDLILRATQSTEPIDDAHVIETKEFLIQGDAPQLINWKEYGIMIKVSESSLLPTDTAKVKIKALIGGNFEFPPNIVVVSGVYDVTVSEPLLKPIRIDIEHCVDITNHHEMKDLKFAFAPSVDSPGFPYQFSILQEGTFAVGSQYGTIYRSEFSKYCITISPDKEDPPTSSGEEDNASIASTLNGEKGDDQHDTHEGVGQSVLNVESSTMPDEDNCQHVNGEGQKENSSKMEEGSNGVSFTLDQNMESLSNQEENLPIDIRNDSENKKISVEKQSNNNDITGASQVLPKSTKESPSYKKMRYSGQVFYEWINKKAIFVCAQKLNVFSKCFKKEYNNPEPGQDVHFYFSKELEGYVELKFIDTKEKDGWIVEPLLDPPRLFRLDIDNFGIDENLSLPTCQILLCPDGPDAVTLLCKTIPLEGVVEKISFKLVASKDKFPQSVTTNFTSSQPAITTAPNHSTRLEDVKEVKKAIISVLTTHHTALAGLSEDSVPTLADELFQVRLITNAIQKKPSINNLVHEFKANLEFKRTINQIHGHCHKFLKAFHAVGASFSGAASVLEEDWTQAVEKIVGSGVFKFE